MTSTQRTTALATCQGNDRGRELGAIALAPGPKGTGVCFAIAKYVTRLAPVRQSFAMCERNKHVVPAGRRYRERLVVAMPADNVVAMPADNVVAMPADNDSLRVTGYPPEAAF